MSEGPREALAAEHALPDKGSMYIWGLGDTNWRWVASMGSASAAAVAAAASPAAAAGDWEMSEDTLGDSASSGEEKLRERSSERSALRSRDWAWTGNGSNSLAL